MMFGESGSVTSGTTDGGVESSGVGVGVESSSLTQDAWMRGEPERRCVRGAVHVWDVASGAADGPPLLSPGAAPTALSFAHTSPRLASISEDGSGWVWDLRARTGRRPGRQAAPPRGQLVRLAPSVLRFACASDPCQGSHRGDVRSVAA